MELKKIFEFLRNSVLSQVPTDELHHKVLKEVSSGIVHELVVIVQDLQKVPIFHFKDM